MRSEYMTHLAWIPLGCAPRRLNTCFTSAKDGMGSEERGEEFVRVGGLGGPGFATVGNREPEG